MTTTTTVKRELNESFSSDQFNASWTAFAETRKKFQAEYQLLLQPFDIDGTKVTLHLLSSVQESMLAGLRSELIAHLRDQLRNDSILVDGAIREIESKKMIYTSRDKFEYLQKKLPVLKELKDRMGLDPDF